MTDRIPGLRGRRPARAPGNRFAIRWAHEYGAPAAPTYPIDVSKDITDWGMLGNDKYGDCGPVGYEHDRMLAGAKPTTDETVALYLDYTKGRDEGVVIADFLLWLFQGGIIEGFAPVELSTIDAVMARFKRGVILGVALTDDAEQLFTEGKPWTVANGETPDQSEGHVILKVKAESANGDGTAVTWGANQVIERGWQKACIEEAWVIVTKDDMTDASYAELVSDLEALPHATVRPPKPVPAPTPTPEPSPAPPNDVHSFVKRIREIFHAAVHAAERVEQEFIAFIEGEQ